VPSALEIARLEPHAISLEYFETFVRFANLILVQASVFSVSLWPLSESHYRRDNELQRPLEGGPGDFQMGTTLGPGLNCSWSRDKVEYQRVGA